MHILRNINATAGRLMEDLQLMTCEGYNSRTEEQEQIKSELKAIASERDIPIVLLSQMSRTQEEEELKQELVVITEE